jgi:muramoyltetrapeptide carboxypeptidase
VFLKVPEMIRPKRLGAGSRVALVSPAGPITPERFESALAQCASFGFEAVPGTNVHARSGYLAGSDTERAADLQNAIDRPDVDAIWALRGGYGVMRIIERIDFHGLIERPRAFIGFSDNTVIHLALARAGIVSFHGPHAGAAMPPVARDCFERVLMCADAAGKLPLYDGADSVVSLRGGVADGLLIGGNLALLAATCGTSLQLSARGKIVVIEDVGEPLYRADRMLTQLALSGALEGAAALAFGRFTEMTESASETAALLGEFAGQLDVPAVFGLPFGHVDDNWTLPFGVRARLDAGACTLALLEPAVCQEA